MAKFKKHFTKGFEDLVGKEEIIANYKGRKFSNCFKQLAEAINVDFEEIRTEIKSSFTDKKRDDMINSQEILSDFNNNKSNTSSIRKLKSEQEANSLSN